MAELAGVWLHDSVTVAEGEGGLPVLRVSAPAGAGDVYLHGAHVTAWAPCGKAPVIWMSRKSMFEPGQPIRGGVPLCFPWFGPGRNDAKSPAHGFARLAALTLTSVRSDGGTVTAALRLTDGDVADLPGTELWPHRFEAVYREIFGPELSLELTVRNTGEEEYSFEEALHTYLHVSDVHELTVGGLDGPTCVDKTSGGALVTQDGPVVFTGETDRVYRSRPRRWYATAPRTLTVSKSGSASTVVWNPWAAKATAMPDYDDEEWPTMVCLETANVLDDAVVLAPERSHTMRADRARLSAASASAAAAHRSLRPSGLGHRPRPAARRHQVRRRCHEEVSL